MKIDEIAQSLIEELGGFTEVEAIALGGSRANGNYDKNSDYDIYVYCNGLPEFSARNGILKKYCKRAEVGNSFWEYEDDVTLLNGVDMDIVYRNLDGFAKDLAVVADKFNARNGYTTCMWYNLVNCEILCDKNGRLTSLKKEYERPYPAPLKRNIIDRNMRLLSGYLPSFDGQIKKAALRGDLISVNHRLTEFFASYFDIIFALNERLHPGEKRLVELCERYCGLLPKDFRANIESVLKISYSDPNGLTDGVKRIVDELKAIVP